MLSLPIIIAIFRLCVAVPVKEPRATNELALDAKGVNFIAGFEGFRANFYTDAAVGPTLVCRLEYSLLTYEKGSENHWLGTCVSVS